MKKIMTCLVMIMTIFVLVGCSSGKDGYYYDSTLSYGPNLSDTSIPMGESYNSIVENPFVNTTYENNSYFSMDSFTASYSNLRRYINGGMNLPADIIKTDELINYFNHNLIEPADGETFSISAEMGKTPWNENTSLVTIGVKTKTEELDKTKGNNIVFLIDVSGSMSTYNKLPLVKEAMCMLVDTLSENDCISIVTYASGVKTVLDGGYSDNKESIKNKINSLEAKGATNGEGGIELAYEVCEKHFIPGGNNRIIIASDGDFNVGKASQTDVEGLIKEKLNTGIYLTALGFGMGNFKDTTMETLAKNGNGGYAYIDSIKEAKKVLVDEIDKTLVTVAKDVKNMVNFNPDYVSSYRLIGYENKLLTEDDFNDEKKDAGEVGSGHTTIVCYEVVLKENVYESTNGLFDVTINYKDPTTNASKTTQKSFNAADINHQSENFYFVSALVEFSLALRNSPYKENSTYQHALETLDAYCSNLLKNDEYKQEFYNLVIIALEKGLVAEKTDQVKIEIYTDFGKKIMFAKKNALIDEETIIKEVYGNDNGYAKVYCDSDFTIRFNTGYAYKDMVVFIQK